MSKKNPEKNFLSVAGDFQLGMLDTERCHPLTSRLSDWAKNDLARAIAALRQVDREALDAFEKDLPKLIPLSEAIHRTISRGNRIFLCGCGATGRLSISLEVYARNGLLEGAGKDNVTGFMAGGDAALIRSIERFEDRPDYGVRQLSDLGFSQGDLLIASTEGGETPFVIGAAEAAAGLSSQPPFFLYCNPDELLAANVDRSRRVLQNDSIQKIGLPAGPMALSGSTRMQASTVLMAAIGFAMKHSRNPDQIASDFLRWRTWVLDELDWERVAPFIEAETKTYEDGEFVIYEPEHYGLAVLTDTTERSPTFTLVPFERRSASEPPSLSYLWIRGTKNAAQAWRKILHRTPNPVEWGSLRHLTTRKAMQDFDFSDPGRADRISRTGKPNHEFLVSRSNDSICWKFRGQETALSVPEEIDFFGENLALKMLLNAHSTLIMGRMGRYEDNLMTYVSANNFKLIDRAVRYVRLLLERHHGYEVPYRTAAQTLLEEREKLAPDEPIVLKTVENLLRMRDAD